MAADREKLRALLRQLKEAQHHALAVAAGRRVMPTSGALRRIAALESALAAVENMAEE